MQCPQRGDGSRETGTSFVSFFSSGFFGAEAAEELVTDAEDGADAEEIQARMIQSETSTHSKAVHPGYRALETQPHSFFPPSLPST